MPTCSPADEALIKHHHASPNSVANSAWHHIVAVISAPAGTTLSASNLHLYVDGVEVTSNLVGMGTFTGVSPLPFNINTSGQAQGFVMTESPNFAGGTVPYMDLDEYAVYSYALTPTQILNHYKAGI